MADLIGLPVNGAQLNNDRSAGIDPHRNAKESDVVGGSLTGGARVAWAVFRQQTSGADQIFSRSFAGGVWNTGQWHRGRAFERQLDVPRLT